LGGYCAPAAYQSAPSAAASAAELPSLERHHRSIGVRRPLSGRLTVSFLKLRGGWQLPLSRLQADAPPMAPVPPMFPEVVR